MKENIKFFETLNDADEYIINDIPFTGYIKENEQVIFNNKPNKILIIEDGQAIIHEINIVFNTLNDADGYIIETIPFSCYIKENQQLLECNQENCKIVVENGIAIIKERGNIIRYTSTSKVTPYQPSSLPTIISNDFDSNTKKGIIKFATDVTSIGDYAFRNCTGLVSVIIPNSVTSIGNLAFYGCGSLTSVTIPNSVMNIGSNAFASCTKLTSINIPNSIIRISDSTFSQCTSLTSITIPNSITFIESQAFFNCSSLASITIPNSVTNIGISAFFGCTSLISITIPNGITNIVSSAFGDCSSLTSVTIPNSVTSIGNYAFSNCRSLTSISYTGTIQQYNSITKGNQWYSGVPATQVYCLGENPPNYTPI